MVCNVCGGWRARGNQLVRYFVDMSQWDGSDFFRFGRRLILVSERVAELANRLGESFFKCISLEPLQERRWAPEGYPIEPPNLIDEIFRGPRLP